VSVEVLAGSVVAHGGFRVGVAGGDLYVAEADTSVEHSGDNVSEHMWVIRTPAVVARRRRRRVAAWRSIRAPLRLSRIGPRTRSPTARPIALPTAGGNGVRSVVLPDGNPPHTTSTPEGRVTNP
jgi:hypothetical protein